ncbi:glycosyltransferase family 39 protein [Streptomyces sp. ME02-7008A-1]|uniref:ArnT family glycosyltransferase n=1 Tax=unclassified Streptomyces TaxID=2593676 RepID=UPI0029B97607|nr:MULTISPECIES: glycosyltransferase family 39 protein [unclassified Streptomyces]MDX3184272.1 glycosyltransferase family 39 protein [Streptomyces sp. ME02-7008A-1]MDX3304349.1 glycosyltransferase family 39 protein [Streptomyces sp. ME02-7008A]
MTAATHADHVQARPDTPGEPAHTAGSREPLVRRVRRGRPEDPRWARPAFLAMLLVIALAYLWNLSASGYANSFYSAAVQAGSQSWKAFFFGSLDSANAITVDKPPATLWPMALSVRIFGLSSWAILAPQVLMGVATAGVLYAAVRRRFSAAAGLITMAVFALTPVAALMFRFNNPDALLALLMTATVYCVLRAFEGGRTKWLVWAGVAVGLAFLSKTLQAFLILPPLAVLYAVFAPVSVRKRFGQLGLAALATVVSAGWWVAIVELWPASSRPYIGGSQNNSFLELTFGYNGLGRINGEETGSVGGGGGGGQGGGWGETGIGRMFNSEIGGQISWLLPAALILLVAGVWLTRRAKRTDTARAAFLAWGGSLLMTAFVFSFMAGIFHQYYTVALAPSIAALVGMGASVLWEERGRWWAVAVLGVTVAATAVWSYVLLGRTPDYVPWLRWAVLAGGLVAAVGLLFAARLGRALALGAVGLGLAASLAGPTAYTISTLNTGHQGSIVTAGPSAGGMGGPGGGMGGGRPPGQGTQQDGGQGMPQGGQAPGNGPGNAQGGGFPGGGTPGQGQQGQGQGRMPGGQQGGMPGGGTGEGGTGGGGGGMGGLLDGASVDSEAKMLLKQNADAYTWTAAAIGSQNAASYQLATGDPVMAIGGFNGSDPSPTLAQFKKYVEDGEIHYFVSGGMGGGGMGGEGSSSRISAWVQENFKEVTVGSATFYDLTRPTG